MQCSTVKSYHKEDLSSAVTWSTLLKSSQPQNRHSRSQCANHGVQRKMFFETSTCPVNHHARYANELSARKQSPTCLFAAVEQTRMLTEDAQQPDPLLFVIWLVRKKAAEWQISGALQHWCLIRAARRLPGWWEGSLGELLLTPTASAQPAQQRRGRHRPYRERDSWHGALASDYQCCMGRGKHHP